MMNVNLKDVLECKRIMNYGDIVIEYTTGIDAVYVNANDILFVMQNAHSEFGYVQTLEDLVYLLEKNHCLSKSLSAFDHVEIADYLYENHINIDSIIKLADKCKANKFKQFLTEAKDIINKYGLYVPNPKMKHYDRRRNNERNLAETFDLNVLGPAASRLGMYEDDLYVGLANIVSLIVFHNDIESVRYNLNMLYEDYLSDYISDFEYDMIAYCCKIISYLLKYSDVGLYGVEVLTKMALDVAMRDFDRNKYDEKKRATTNLVDSIFDKALYGNNELEYNEHEVMYKKEKVSDKDVEDFRRYM
jgi:hypothetical protein